MLLISILRLFRQRNRKLVFGKMLMQPASSSPDPEILFVEDGTDVVSCDGGGGALGHPVVYYSFNGRDRVECGYCDRVFIRKEGKIA